MQSFVLYCVSTSIMIYTGHIASTASSCPTFLYVVCSVCHITRPTMNLRTSENSSENADIVVGFLLVLKFPHEQTHMHALKHHLYIQLTWPIIIFVCIFVIERKVIMTR